MADTTHQRIIQAVQLLLKSRGAEGLTLEEAASLARVSRKTVYNHFPNREELIEAAVSSWMGKTIAKVNSLALREDLPFLEKLNSIVELGFRELDEGGRILGPPRRELLDPRSESLRAEMQQSLLALIEGLVKRTQQEGYIKANLDYRRLSRVFFNMFAGLTVYQEQPGESFSRAQLLEDSIKAVVSGILSPAGREAMKDSPLFIHQEETQ